MARPGRKSLMTGVAAAAALAIGLSLAALAQHGTATPPASASEAKSDPTLPPVSRDCQAGSAQATASAPLPNVAKALRERGKIVILAVGSSPIVRRDSMSGGYYDLVENLLEQTFKGLQVSIVHRGVPGEMARDAGARIKMEVGLVDPDLVLWQVGTADALARLPIEDFEASVADTLAWLKSHDTDAVLIGLHYVKALTKDAHYQAIRKSLKKITTDQGVLRISRYEAAETIARIRSEQGAPMSSEKLTEAVYECSAEYLARAIAAGLFLKQPKDGAAPAKPAEK
jgi:hypothetical protein